MQSESQSSGDGECGRDEMWENTAAAAAATNPRVVEGMPPMVCASMTWEHALMVDRDGAVWAWGNGHNGRTGLGHERMATAPVGPLRRGALSTPDDGGLRRASRCYTSKEHSLVLMSDGGLVGFGRAAGGALPTAAGSESDMLVPVELTALEGVRRRGGGGGGGSGGGFGGSGECAVACGSVAGLYKLNAALPIA
jgi:hypothetical protein